MSTEFHHTEAQPIDRTDLPDDPPRLEGDIIGRWIARLEDQTRRFPRESLQISFLLGALLQILPDRGLLPRLARLGLWLARPIVFGFAAWRLYQLVRDARSSSGKKSVAVDES